MLEPLGSQGATQTVETLGQEQVRNSSVPGSIAVAFIALELYTRRETSIKSIYATLFLHRNKGEGRGLFIPTIQARADILYDNPPSLGSPCYHFVSQPALPIIGSRNKKHSHNRTPHLDLHRALP